MQLLYQLQFMVLFLEHVHCKPTRIFSSTKKFDGSTPELLFLQHVLLVWSLQTGMLLLPDVKRLVALSESHKIQRVSQIDTFCLENWT